MASAPTAREALGRLGEVARDAEDPERAEATLARRPEAIPLLAAFLDDPDEAVSTTASSHLGRIGPEAGSAVPALIDELAAENDVSTYKVATAMGLIGPVARGVIEPLERISAHAADVSLRMEADRALFRITQGEKEIEPLIKELRDGPDFARSSALSTLGQIGRGAGPAVPAITELLRDDNQNRIDIAATLGQIGPPAQSALPLLIDLFNDENLFYKEEVAEAIRAIDPATAKALGIR